MAAEASINDKDICVDPTGDTPARDRPKMAGWVRAAKLLVVALVVLGISQALRSAAAELRDSPLALRDLKLYWLVVAGLLYAVAQIPLAWYWQRLLNALRVVVAYENCLRAFFYGHLGKYVPGKLLVVIMRSGLLGLRPNEIPLAASSVFIETFTYMAAGSFAAATGIMCLYPEETALQIFALAVMLMMVAATWPPLLRRALQTARRWGIATHLDVASSVNTALIAKGWGASLVAWLLNAMSLYAVLRSLPMAEALALDLTTFARMVTSLCAAVVAGFVSMVPGGLLAREYVLDRLLVPHVGEAYALIAAVLLRVVWLLTELIGSTILYVAGKRQLRPQQSV